MNEDKKEDNTILFIFVALVFFWFGVALVGFYIFKVEERMPIIQVRIYKQSTQNIKRLDSTYLEI